MTERKVWIESTFEQVEQDFINDFFFTLKKSKNKELIMGYWLDFKDALTSEIDKQLEQARFKEREDFKKEVLEWLNELWFEGWADLKVGVIDTYRKKFKVKE